jgi:hypothetical protein
MENTGALALLLLRSILTCKQRDIFARRKTAGQKISLDVDYRLRRGISKINTE